MAVVAAVYRDTAGFPAEEMFALTAHIRRTALALPARLADGATRDTIEALLHCLDMSCGSLAALDTQLEIAIGLGYLEPNAGAVIGTRRLGMLMSVLRQWLRNEAIRQSQVGAFGRSKAQRRGASVRSPRVQLRSPVTDHRSRRIIS